MPKKGEHSREAKELVTEIIARLEDIPDGCAECFPFELIDELKQEYLTDKGIVEEIQRQGLADAGAER